MKKYLIAIAAVAAWQASGGAWAQVDEARAKKKGLAA